MIFRRTAKWAYRLVRFHGTIQEQESGFAKWLAVHAPGPSDGSDLSRAREVIRAWPLLRDVEWSIVETPEQVKNDVDRLITLRSLHSGMKESVVPAAGL